MSAVSPQAVVRAQARGALHRNYARAVAAFIIGMLPVLLIDTVSVIAVYGLRLITTDTRLLNTLVIVAVNPLLLVAGVLLSPFLNGYIRVFYRNALSGTMDLNDLYYYFECGRYSRTLHLNLSLLLRLLLPLILFYLPVAIYEVLCVQLDNGFYGSVLYRDAYFILAVMSTVAATLYALRYYTVFTLYIENEDMEVKELFRASREIMRSRSGDAARLIFSYTPWMLLCLTILPILYVVPYMTQGLCIGAKWMTRAAYEESR